MELPFSASPNPLPLENMSRIASERAADYRNANPFPHIALDNFFDETMLSRVLDEFPNRKQIKWTEFDNYHEVKLSAQKDDNFGPATKWLMYHLNSSYFINFLEELTGIQGLLPDPHFEGGGLHQIMPGGKLGVHADFNKHRKLNVDRRINLLVYLNKNWKEEYGGQLELWDKTMEHSIVKILPIFNRIVLFSTTDTAYHGHPEPLKCPEDMSRKSIALYYYSNGRPEEEVTDSHSTLFKLRPNEKAKRSLKQLVKAFIPPIVLEVKHKLSGKM